MRKDVRVLPVVVFCCATAGLGGAAWAWGSGDSWPVRSNCGGSYGNSLNCQGTTTATPQAATAGAASNPTMWKGPIARHPGGSYGGGGGTTTGSSGGSGGTTTGSSGGSGGTTTGSSGGSGGTTTGSSGGSGGTTTGSSGGGGGTTTGSSGSSGGTTTTAGALLPADRLVAWNPGMMSQNGIPNRSTIYTTLSPSGGDDTAAIQAAINAAPAGQVVMLSSGSFTVNGILMMNRPITLRGAGAGVTKLVKSNGARPRTSQIIAGTNGITTPIDPTSYTYDPSPLIIVGGSRWNNGPDNTATQNLTADGAQGATTITVANASSFTAGTYVLLDEVSGATWQPTPAGFPGGAKVWQGDRVAWNMHYPQSPGDDAGASSAQGPYDSTPGVSPVAMSWFSRTDRPINEIKQIASISGSTITFTSPLTISYRTSHQAQLTPYTVDPNNGSHSTTMTDAHVSNVGVENMSLIGGADDALEFFTAAYSWAKGIEVTQWLGAGVSISNSFRIEVRNSYIHTGSWPMPGGAGYTISLQNGSSEVLIENNIFLDACKVMVFRSSGAGTVVGYNYADDSFDFNLPTWVEVGINGSHMAGSHHVLFEGNMSQNADSDYTHGNSIYLTFFRNNLTGHRRSLTDGTNLRAAGLAYGSWWDSVRRKRFGRLGPIERVVL